MKINQNAQVTTSVKYRFFDHTILVEFSDTKEGFQWRINVDGNNSPWTNFYEGILEHKGYGLVSTYFEGVLKPWVPFKIDYCNKYRDCAMKIGDKVRVIKNKLGFGMEGSTGIIRTTYRPDLPEYPYCVRMPDATDDIYFAEDELEVIE